AIKSRLHTLAHYNMILVTGGTGFIGSYIIKNLVEKGFTVRATRRSARLPFYIPEEIFQKVEWVDGEVRDIVSLTEAMEGVDSVIHAAAIISFSKHNRQLMYQVNVEGTANVVNAALEKNVRRLLHVSSVAALGRTKKEQTVSEDRKWVENAANTHYAITKHHAELQVWRGFAEGLDGIIVNPSTVLGYGDWNQSSCAIFRNVYRGFPWYTNGINGFVGVEDVAEATVRLLSSGASHRRFIVNAENIAFRTLFNMIADAFGKKRPHREASRLMGEIAWRLEYARSVVTRRKPLLTRETARVAHSRTSFDNRLLLETLPGFSFAPLQDVVQQACAKYLAAVQQGTLTV
ncbi:MAG TPA: SDR family NAD(P)-dependent oxidoreductase, partial [Flavisolibacter sp.]